MIRCRLCGRGIRDLDWGVIRKLNIICKTCERTLGKLDLRKVGYNYGTSRRRKQNV